MSQKKERNLWLILLLSPIWIWIIWFIVSFVFFIISDSSWWISTESSLLVIKNFINFLLWLLSLLSLVSIPLWIFFIVKSNKKKDYDSKIIIENNIENIYSSDFDVSKVLQHDTENIKNHNFTKSFSPLLAIFLNIITLWFFWIFYYGFESDNLPRIKNDDFWSWKGIWFMFIPLFNIYRCFVFRLELTNRINLQYRIRNKETPISKWLVLTSLILNLIPYVGLISFFIISPIVIYQIQTAINNLVKE